MKSVLLPIIRPIWRRMWVRWETHLEARLSPIDGRIASLEQGWNVHLPAFLNAVSTVGAFGHRLSALTQEVKQLSIQLQELKQMPVPQQEFEAIGALGHRLSALTREVEQLSMQTQELKQLPSQEFEAVSNQIPHLWDRIEFVRREIMFELAHGGNSGAASLRQTGSREPQIVNRKKVEAAIAAGNVRLNLGCGHKALPDYLNVDMRELPGVDIVAAIDGLPFEPGSVSEIYSAHLVEHFPQEAMRRRLLPYWMSLLKPGGIFQAITPDAAAMLKAAATEDYAFEDFREVLFGAQDYEGDYHYNLFTPDSMTTLLKEVGLIEIVVPVAGRRNGKCYEFEITGRRS